MTSRLRRVAFPVVVLVAALVLASTLSPVLSPVFFAILLAVILNPLVEAAGRLRLPRVVTVSVLYVLLVLLVVLVGSAVKGQFASLGRALVGEPFYGDLDGDGLIDLAQAPGERDEFDDRNGNGVWDGGALYVLRSQIEHERSRLATGPLEDLVDEVGTAALDIVERLAVPATSTLAEGLDRLAAWAGGMLQLVTLAVLVPFYLFFFLVEYPRMRRRVHDLLPHRHQAQVERITRDIGRELAAFLRGRLACGMVKGLLLLVGMMILGLPYALPIALASGLLSLVPILGFLVGFVPASIIAMTMPGGGTETFLYVAVLFGLAEALEGAVLFPWLLGRETGLHPVTLVVVLLAGGYLLGTLGVLVAIPLALVVKVLWRELGLRFYREWAEG